MWSCDSVRLVQWKLLSLRLHYSTIWIIRSQCDLAVMFDLQFTEERLLCRFVNNRAGIPKESACFWLTLWLSDALLEQEFPSVSCRTHTPPSLVFEFSPPPLNVPPPPHTHTYMQIHRAGWCLLRYFMETSLGFRRSRPSLDKRSIQFWCWFLS